MIIKGNRHGNGAKLAAYLLDGGRHGERVAAPELFGFGLHPDDISKSFYSLDAIASGRGIENPLFHIQIRLPEGEQMTREQWDETTARALKTAGLQGQPYARVFHTDEKTGEIHCHVGVSMIDEETHKAKAVPFYKFRFKALARKLEVEFDLTRVRNERDGPILYAATKNEQQQAQRLGVDKDAIRNAIRACWERSDCGRSFDDALASEGMILAQGTRRDYVVMDHAGGLHALGKRILDASAGQVRARLADLDRDQMPTIDQAREFMLDLPRDRADRLTRELADVQKQLAAEQEYARRDPVRDEIQWQDALGKAAIAKEKTERQFVEPKGNENEKPAAERNRTQPGNRKEDGGPVHSHQPEQRRQQATAETRDRLKDEIRFTPATANDHSIVADAYEDFFALGTVASAKVEAQKRQQWERRQAQRETEKNPPAVARPGPEVWMAQSGGYAALSPELKTKAEKDFDHWKNHGRGRGTSYNIDAYVSYAQQRWAERPPLDFREANADAKGTLFLKGIGREFTDPAAKVLNTAARVINQAPVRMAGKILDVFARAAEGLLAPPVLTPEQKYEAEKTANRREADAEASIDYSRYTADAALQRRQQENDREAEHQRQRDGRER